MKDRTIPLFVSVLAMFLALVAGAQPAAADGIIIPVPPIDRPPMPWRDVPLTIEYHRVDVTIRDQIATTHVDQVFVNEADYAVEGTYVFPLPEDAAISSFDMWVDGEKLEGKLLDRDEARQIYEEIVRSQRDPALLEYVGRGAFQASIFPIPPGEERRVELTYSQILSQQEGLVHYRYPLNTEKFSSRPIPEVAVTVTVEEDDALRAIYSPSHPVDVTRGGEGEATIGYEASNVLPDRDFDLYYSLSPDAIAVNLLSYKTFDDDGYFLLLVTPPVESESQEVVAKDVVLVLDVSGSMAGEKLVQAKDAAHYVLDNLGEDDRFNIVAFSTATRLFASGPVPANRRAEGKSFIDDLRDEGSTDINRALLEALADADSERPTIVIFLTDGLPTVGELDPDRIVDNVTEAAPEAVRLFAFGLGYDVDTFLLDQLSSGLRGTSGYVQPDQAIDEEVSAFYAKVSAPVLVDVGLYFSGITVEDIYPYPLPDLFAGTQLVVAGRYRGAGEASLTLSGEVNNAPQTHVYENLQFGERGGNDYVSRLWAQRKIGYLLTQIRLQGPDEELVREIVDLSTRHGIVTPYTSFLVEEPGMVLSDSGREELAAEAMEAPAAGGNAEAGGGAPALAPSVRSGADAVGRAVVEKELSGGEYAGESTTAQIRQVGDKAFIRDGDRWMDTTYDSAAMKAERIAFGSDRYFQLMSQHPEIGPYLALGDQVTVVIDDTAYEIGPEGESNAEPEAAPEVTTAPATAARPLPTAATVDPEETPSALAPAAAVAAPATLPGACGGALVVGLIGLVLPMWVRNRRL